MDSGGFEKNNLHRRIDVKKTEKFSQYFLIFALLGVSIIFFNIIKIFLIPIILASVFTVLFYPMFRILLRFFRNRKGMTAFICCIILLLILLVPTYIVVNIITREAIELYQTAGPKIQAFYRNGDQGLLKKFNDSQLVKRLQLNQIDWRSAVQDLIKGIASYAGRIINRTSKGTIMVVTNVVFTIFTMFYFFKDGDKIVSSIMSLLPLHEKYKESIIAHFISTSRATVKGTLIIGLIQGTLGGLTLFIFGFTAPVMWGTVMVILSIIPVLGSWMVLIPAGIYEMITGSIWYGLGVILISTLIISNIDNFLRPRLIGKDAKMHDLFVFFATLGGINYFGIMGFIIGPVIASMLMTLFKIYGIEFSGLIREQEKEGIINPHQ